MKCQKSFDEIYLVEAEVNFFVGTSGSFVTGSSGGKISKLARTVAITSQIAVSARFTPGQRLQKFGLKWIRFTQFFLCLTNLRPKPNMIVFGSTVLTRNRSGLKSSGEENTFSS